MHNVLTIREILLLILQSFDEKKRETRPNLYALSLVCKDFHELALNELWHTQLSLIPILSLLVGDAIQVKHISSPPLQEGLTEALRGAIPTRVLYLARPLTENDVLLILKYSSRVRALEFSFDKSPKRPRYSIHYSIVQGLKIAANPIFPRLRELEWYSWRECFPAFVTYAPFYELVISPKLEYLDLHFPDEPIEERILDHIWITCRHLKKLVFTCHSTPESTRVTQKALQKLTSLEEIHLPYHLLNWSIWRTCTLLPKLSRLTVDIGVIPATTFWSQLPTRSLNLKVLCLYTHDIQNVIDFLSNATFPFLRDIVIVLPHGQHSPPLGEKATKLFKSIADACSAEILDLIYITQEVPYKFDSNIPNGYVKEDYVIKPSALLPLFKFRNMEEFWMQCGWCWDLDDDFVVQACRAWPKLASLVLDPNHLWPKSNLRITLGVLESFVEFLPNLQCFGATLNARNPPKQARTPRGTIHAKLRDLYVSYSPLDLEGEVAAFLSKIFPNINAIDGSMALGPSGRREQDFLWSLVPDLICSMIEVREEERRWLTGEGEGVFVS